MSGGIFEPTEVRKDLDRLDRSLRKLRTQYELFLARITKWPPNETLMEVEAIIRHYTKYPPHRTVDRFRFNTLVHRHRTSMERWRRRQRKLEQIGSGHPRAGSRRADEDLSVPQTLMITRAERGEVKGEQLRDLYLAYRQARKARGLNVAKLRYRKFVETVGRHLQTARSRAGDRDLELRVDTAGGKVTIAVRPVAGSSGDGTDGSARG
ncbi:MAG: hypothetical protein D6718_13355 [Acidobacteria bacterium]|nr:MAG: hypothetical protein D6718_13355 [Acidobacteriota bacterium]